MPDRSPIIIISLVVIANLCADFMLAWNWSTQTPRGGLSEVAYFALLSGQLSAICIWAILRERSSLWVQSVPIFAAIIASLAFNPLDSERLFDFAPYFGVQAAGVVVVMWIFRRSRFWRLRSGIQTDWQFSIAQLLVATTVVALLTFAVRYSKLVNDLDDDTRLFVGLVSGSIALAVTATYLWSLRTHPILRFAGVLAVAIGLGLLFLLSDLFMVMFATVHFLIQGCVLSLFLAWGGILPFDTASKPVSCDRIPAP
jgi:hypothetical protein